MASKKQLIERWKMEPWKGILKNIFDKVVKWADIRGRISQRAYEQTGLYLIPPEQEPPFDTIKEIFEPLSGLPYHDEVLSNRDLRGSPFECGGFGWDLRETDFSYLTPEQGHDFHHSLLDNAKFDGSKGEFAFHGKYTRVSFRKVHFHATTLKGTFFSGSFRSCDFSHAIIKKAYFHDKAELRDCSFAEANLTWANFMGCDLRGCDFRGANLSNAIISGAVLDKNTDFRGANLTGLRCEKTKVVNRVEEIDYPAVDWRIANFDGSTIHD
jgi:uncharacterized protein YjbI with pentapeptide repeats